MARQKSNKETKSINFEKIVLEEIELKCKKEKIGISTFINKIMKKVVLSEYEFYRQLMKDSAADLHKYKTLMETAPDKPKEE